MADQSRLLEAALRYTPHGKKVVVTGGSKGIGRAVVEEFAALGCHIFTCARQPKDLEELLAQCAAKGWSVRGAGKRVRFYSKPCPFSTETMSRFNFLAVFYLVDYQATIATSAVADVATEAGRQALVEGASAAFDGCVDVLINVSMKTSLFHSSFSFGFMFVLSDELLCFAECGDKHPQAYSDVH
jgi:NAD(P)-dependent dehydrogenase (short-subunit alcohol dehydrogenase family)